MTTTRWMGTITFGFGLITVGIPAVRAETKTTTFTATTGNFDVGANWDMGVPDADDIAVIQNGKTCNIVIAPDPIGKLVVESNATLNIAASLQLAINGTGGIQSTLDGTINLEGSGSDLKIKDINQSFLGSGKIVGKHPSALITAGGAGDNRILTSEVTIEGTLIITGFKFINQHVVHANADGTLHVNTSQVDDDTSALWKVSQPTGPTVSPILKFAPTTTGVLTILDGDFEVLGGLLDVDNDFKTTGTYYQTGTGTLDHKDGSAVFEF